MDAKRPIGCSSDKPSVIRILKNALIECCLDITFDTLAFVYNRPNIVPMYHFRFTIKGDKLTIFTTINELCQKYIDIEPYVESRHTVGRLENIYSIRNKGFNFTSFVSPRFTRPANDTLANGHNYHITRVTRTTLLGSDQRKFRIIRNFR